MKARNLDFLKILLIDSIQLIIHILIFILMLCLINYADVGLSVVGVILIIPLLNVIYGIIFGIFKGRSIETILISILGVLIEYGIMAYINSTEASIDMKSWPIVYVIFFNMSYILVRMIKFSIRRSKKDE